MSLWDCSKTKAVREEVERRDQVAEHFVNRNNRSDSMIDYRVRKGSESKQGRLTGNSYIGIPIKE